MIASEAPSYRSLNTEARLRRFTVLHLMATLLMAVSPQIGSLIDVEADRLMLG